MPMAQSYQKKATYVNCAQAAKDTGHIIPGADEHCRLQITLQARAFEHARIHTYRGYTNTYCGSLTLKLTTVKSQA